MIMKFVRKHWKKIIVILVVLFFVHKIYATFINKQAPVENTLSSVVEVFSLSEGKEGVIDAFCSVEARSDVAIIPETSGKVTSVSVQEGAEVKKGETLFSLENINQRVAVQNARVSLRSAELALTELLQDNDQTNTNSLLAQTALQQETLIANAYNRLLNNDLQAYPEDDPENASSAGPTINGNYTCKQEGEYIVKVYSSSTESGASISYSGLESGTVSASTSDFGTLLGSCGLELIFPKNFKKNKTWVIPVPNTRSSQYFSVKKDYENALSGKEIVLNNTQASPEAIARERARVTQARLQLESAQNNLSKTIVVAPVSGTLSGFDVEKGDFVSQGADFGRVKSIDELELVAYVNADEQGYLATDSSVDINGEATHIERVSPTVDSETKKIKVTIAAPKDQALVEGTEQSCQITRVLSSADSTISMNGGTLIPLSALSIIGIESYVFHIQDSKAVQQKVETGALLGDSIVVYGLEQGNIIRDARGIREGQDLVIK